MQPILIPENLKKSRERLGITRVEAARRMNIPQSSYIRYEKGDRKPTHATIVQMAQVLGTSVDYLTGASDEDVADTIVVSKEKEPDLYEMAATIRELDPEHAKQAFERIKKYAEKYLKGKE